MTRQANIATSATSGTCQNAFRRKVSRLLLIITMFLTPPFLEEPPYIGELFRRQSTRLEKAQNKPVRRTVKEAIQHIADRLSDRSLAAENGLINVSAVD